MAMTVTYVDRQKNRKILLPELTSYVLPDSGKLMIREIASSHIYINGDSYEVENRTRDIEIKDYPLEIEVDGSLYRVRVLCGQCREETKFDYNTLRTAFLNNLVQERMDEDILFSAISEELDALKIPLCTFNRKFESITKDYDVVAMEECTNQLLLESVAVQLVHIVAEHQVEHIAPAPEARWGPHRIIQQETHQVAGNTIR